MKQKLTDLVKQITAVLTALMMFLAGLGYTFDQFNPNTIEALGIVLTALIPLGITLYGIYMNTFVSKTAFDKAKMKEAQRMIDEGKVDVEGAPVIEIVTSVDAEDGADL